SRRRHTRSYGDWSSDVCSSDLDSLRRVESPPAAEGSKPGKEALQFRGKEPVAPVDRGIEAPVALLHVPAPADQELDAVVQMSERSEERRVGNESRCRWRRGGGE